MMWLRRAMGLQDMERPAPSPIENNPVGWSSIYPPQVATNASPDFSPLADPGQFTNEQRLGAFWNLATRRAKPYTNRDLPQLSEAANEAYDAAAGFVGMSTPIRAYHGSPHTFDRFDMSKIGTGEAGQSYGHGLYFAGNEKTAQHYKEALSGNRPGSMYEVSLRTSPKRLLDWDKPLSQQPAAVRGALAKIGVESTLPQPYNGMPLGNGAKLRIVEDPDFGPKMFMDLASGGSFRIDESAITNLIGKPGSEIAGKGAYVSAVAKAGGDPAAAQTLRNAGIDGIQYLDAGSRAAGEGSRNYVMFRDDIIDILKRYGIFGLGMVGGATAGPYGAQNP